MRIDVITLFPEFIESCALVGVVGRAQSRGLLQVNTCNPRDFATDNHRTVDSRPFGGGPGMLMAIAPLRDALEDRRQRLPFALPMMGTAVLEAGRENKIVARRESFEAGERALESGLLHRINLARGASLEPSPPAGDGGTR